MSRLLTVLVLGLTVFLAFFIPGSSEAVSGPDIPIPSVTLTLPGATVTVRDIIEQRGPTRTVTVRPAPVRATVLVPGPTKFVSVAGPTQTVTNRVTQEIEATVTETATRTVRQTEPRGATLPDKEDEGSVPDEIESAGYGIAAVLVGCGLIILSLWLGYIMGYKDRERKEMKFLDALRDQFYTKGKHRIG